MGACRWSACCFFSDRLDGSSFTYVVTNQQLIEAAVGSLLRLRRADGAKFGNVAAAVAASSGKIYVGVNLFTPAGAANICAEKTAIAAMITAGDYEPEKVVAVWRSAQGGETHVVPPCGWCREFIAQVQPPGWDTSVVVGVDSQMSLSKLLPANSWPWTPIQLT